ncbi:MAG TPA: 6-phosphogluconolactonase [Chloroflexi bacterium]|nr:6-phosphogluconolactonase [Chloroflexota bacterium]
MTRVWVFPDRNALARAAAERFVAAADEAVRARGRFFVALAGGSTPRPAYRLLADPACASRVDWDRVHLFWGDERCVPPDHPESNYRMVREALLDRVPIPVENVHRIRGEWPPEEAAAAYEAELRAIFGPDGRLDLVLLGLGADGHTASLFPGSAALDERERWVAAVFADPVGTWRITLTPPALNGAREVLFLVVGKPKAEALARVLAGWDLPAGRIRPRSGRLSWFVDRDAMGGGWMAGRGLELREGGVDVRSATERG